jgi:hypothetical protein
MGKMNNVENLEKIRKYIEDELAIRERDSIKAIRIFIRTLRDAELITNEEKLQLLYYVDLIIRKKIE